MIWSTMVYEKTSLGLQEILGDTRTLSLRERQVLIMVDGKRSDEALIAYFQKPETKDILLLLLTRRFIRVKQQNVFANIHHETSAHTENIAQAIPPQNITSAHMLTEVEMQPIKEIIRQSIETYLGIMGQAIKKKLENAHTLETLKPIISEWHMALRDSKNGKLVAASLLSEVEQAIHHLLSQRLIP